MHIPPIPYPPYSVPKNLPGISIFRFSLSFQIFKRIYRHAILFHCKIKIRAFYRIIFGRCADISDHFALLYCVTFCHSKVLQLPIYCLITISQLHSDSRSRAGILYNRKHLTICRRIHRRILHCLQSMAELTRY